MAPWFWHHWQCFRIIRGKESADGFLIEAGHRVAREMGFKSALLVGHPKYYPRLGYRPAEVFGIVTDLELPADVFMACELTEGGLDGVQGRMEWLACDN